MGDPRDMQENPENKRNDNFKKNHEVLETVMELAKKLLVSVTEEEFKKLGYEKVNTSAGEYATGVKLGAGVAQNKFNVKVAGKSNASLEKQVFLGTQRIQSDILFEYNNTNVSIEYRTTENGFFRGVDSKGKSYAFIERVSVDGSNKKELEKVMKSLFETGAKKEIGYLTNTRIGVDDKLDQSTVSTVNENDMKKLTIKNIFLGDDIFEESLADKLKAKNTIPAEKVHPYTKSKNPPKGKNLMFDEKGLEERFQQAKGDDKYIQFVKSELKGMFGVDKLSDLTPVEKQEFFNHLSNSYGEEDTDLTNEVTTAGPAGAGAGAFLTPYAFKATPYNQYKGKKKPQITKEYNVVPNTENYNGQFWQKVDVNLLKDTHPIGMPGIKPGSKEELAAATKGDTNKLKRLGLKENEEKVQVKAKIDLTRKKIFSEEENKLKGINKRYLVTEKTSEEYLKERWNKLTNFKIYESINEELEAEMLTENVVEAVKEVVKEVVAPVEVPQEPVMNTAENLEETVTVTKPGSIFGIEYVFYKKDFLNEDKKYILDLASRVFVPNPNTNKTIFTKIDPNREK
jgi:hypothetical protein